MEKGPDKQDGTRASHRQLSLFTQEVFQYCGLTEPDASQAAAVLLAADVDGIRSHGVARLRSYCEMLADGRVNSRPDVRVEVDVPALALVNGDNGLGLVVGPAASRIAMKKAKQFGAAWVSVRHSNHFGIAGFYAAQGLQEDLIGLAFTNTPPLVSPSGGKGRSLGTNPVAAAFPAEEEDPVIVDFASSALSLGAVEVAVRDGTSLPPNCLADASGAATQDPLALQSGGSLLPLGGSPETGGHKGYCLATMVDLLCGPLSGAAWGPFVPAFRSGTGETDQKSGGGTGHLFGFINIEAIRGADSFKAEVDHWIRVMRKTPGDGTPNGVLIPGEPELRQRRQSLSEGIYLDLATVDDLKDLGMAMGVNFTTVIRT